MSCLVFVLIPQQEPSFIDVIVLKLVMAVEEDLLDRAITSYRWHCGDSASVAAPLQR